jgi:hypothetical protein
VGGGGTFGDGITGLFNFSIIMSLSVVKKMNSCGDWHRITERLAKILRVVGQGSKEGLNNNFTAQLHVTGHPPPVNSVKG